MSKVVVVKHKPPSTGPSGDRAGYRAMLTVGLCRLAGVDRPEAALQKLLPPGPVGLKANCLTGRFNATPVGLVLALTELAHDAGWEENDLIIWDRTNRELAEAGFDLNAAGRGVRCLGTDTNGVGYSRTFYSHGRVDSLVSRILTELVESNVNLPILKDHSIAGLSAGLKNMYGAIHNPNKFHHDNCNPFCAQVNNLEPIRTKNRLTIIDAVRVQYDGGPGYMAQYLADYGGLVMSDDPVAADRVGLEILARLRENYHRPPLAAVGREVKYLRSAQDIGLGRYDLEAIELTALAVDVDGSVTETELFG